MDKKQLAKDLLNLFGPNGEHWIQGSLAQTEGRSGVTPRSPIASKWCLLGGIRNTQENTFVAEQLLLDEILKHSQGFTSGGSIPAFNDYNPWPVIKDLLCNMAFPKEEKSVRTETEDQKQV